MKDNDFFSKEDIEDYNEEEDIEEKGDEEELSFESISEIIKERNRINHELSIKIPDYKEKVGYLNLDLFGDPNNNEFLSKIEELEEVINHPMTRTHPIADKAKRVVSRIRELQIEYISWTRFTQKALERIFSLLDNTIIVAKKEVHYAKNVGGKGPIEGPSTVPGVTKEAVDKFMLECGRKYVDRYNEAVEAEDLDEVRNMKSAFLGEAVTFFKHITDYPGDISRRLFSHYAAIDYDELKKRISKSRGPGRPKKDSRKDQSQQRVKEKSEDLPKEIFGDEETEEEDTGDEEDES